MSQEAVTKITYNTQTGQSSEHLRKNMGRFFKLKKRF